jgi:hypothetical protein
MSIWDKLREDLKLADVNNIKHVIETVINELEHNNVVSGILPITADVAKAIPVVEEVATDTEAVAADVNEVAEAVAPVAPVAAPAPEATALFVPPNNPAPIETPAIPEVQGEVVGYPGPIVDANGVQVLIENPDGTMSLNPAATPGHVTQSQLAQAVPHAKEPVVTEPASDTPTLIPPEGA